MTNEDIVRLRFERCIALVESCLASANTISKIARTAYPPKRIFRPKNRTPKSRIDKNAAKAQLIIQPFISAMQLRIIASQPIMTKNYPKGGLPHRDFLKENPINPGEDF